MGSISILREVIFFAFVPTLLCLSWREWGGKNRNKIAPWRNGVALSALILISLNWAVAMVFEIVALSGQDLSILTNLRSFLFLLSHPLDICILILALALTGRVRREVVLATILLFASWPGGYI